MRRAAFIISLFFMCAVFAACSRPAVQDVQLPEHAPVLSSYSLILGNGNILPVRSWLPVLDPKAVVVALHGFNDYSNAYAGAGKYLSGQGIALYAYDQRGFGATGSHGIWPGEANLISDLKNMVLAVKAAYPKVPVYVLGESMGGAVVIVSLADPDFPAVDGAILSAPAVWGSGTMNGLYRMTLWALAHTTPATQLTGQGLKIQASDNIEMLRRLGRDPLVIKRTRIDAIYGIVALMDSAFAKTAQVNVPVLLLYGGKDQVIPPGPIKLAAGKFLHKPTIAFYPTGYHMLMRDLKADMVLNDIAHWIEAPSESLPSGYDHFSKTQLP